MANPQKTGNSTFAEPFFQVWDHGPKSVLICSLSRAFCCCFCCFLFHLLLLLFVCFYFILSCSCYLQQSFRGVILCHMEAEMLLFLHILALNKNLRDSISNIMYNIALWSPEMFPRWVVEFEGKFEIPVQLCVIMCMKCLCVCSYVCVYVVGTLGEQKEKNRVNVLERKIWEY